ncbi:helix-turn-helix domain-containing protein [Pontibacter vulgaris]|uniref:helix-turn-helix domain-containing protein n=1 Tax=Pontibacter vulgaris TaxID=2905679 RepID=UPI001FA6BF0C|nr:helix-turn-helix domain-containing protein [Pontibacter vulgaris]
MQTNLFFAEELYRYIYRMNRLEQFVHLGTRQAFINSRQLEHMLGISKITLLRWRKKGLLPYSRIERSIYYAIADVEALLLSHRVDLNPHVVPANEGCTCSR